jgi:putative Holliday junction resolvase
MGLDLGAKRVGVALSDEMGWTAQALTVLERKPSDKFIAAVKDLVAKHQVTCLVLGLPRNMDGSLGPEAQRVLSMVSELKKHLDVELTTWDERLSSSAAERVLIEADVRRSKRKTVVDKIAAALILQNYLDYLGSRPKEDQ